jgi:hypothetical protein
MTFALTLLLAATPQAAELSDSDISAAIAEGAKMKSESHKIGLWKSGAPGGFHVLVRGPYGRIAAASAEAAAKFLPFGLEQVTDEMKAPLLTVWLEPHKPQSYGSAGWTITRPVKNVVLRPKGSETVVQPKSIAREPRTFGNALGATFTSEAAGVMFDLSAVPDGKFEILTVGERGTGSVTIKDKDRGNIR